MKTSISKYGITIKLDTEEVIPENPGNGTPAMVYDNLTGASATYTCATETGELDFGEVVLTDRQVKWLNEQEDYINKFLKW